MSTQRLSIALDSNKPMPDITLCLPFSNHQVHWTARIAISPPQNILYLDYFDTASMWHCHINETTGCAHMCWPVTKMLYTWHVHAQTFSTCLAILPVVAASQGWFLRCSFTLASLSRELTGSHLPACLLFEDSCIN